VGGKFRWRNQYGGMKAEEGKRLKELEKENSRLKKSCRGKSCRGKSCRGTKICRGT
jgi:hypothetical protein